MSTHYKVTIKQADGSAKVRLVVAANQAQARKHVTDDTITVEVAGVADALALGKAGVEAEPAAAGSPSTV